MESFLEPLLTLGGAFLVTVVAFVKLQSHSDQNRRDIEDLKKANDSNEAKIHENFVHSIKGQGAVQQNQIRIDNLESKMETAFDLLNIYRDKLDFYEKRNNGKH
tara:strand:- start:7788 stop:8099 length:312 start_codon:yes stop_codon:yes gene_type:complete